MTQQTVEAGRRAPRASLYCGACGTRLDKVTARGDRYITTLLGRGQTPDDASRQQSQWTRIYECRCGVHVRVRVDRILEAIRRTPRVVVQPDGSLLEG